MARRLVLLAALILVLACNLLLYLNLATLREGLAFLRGGLSLALEQPIPLESAGPFGMCYEYVRLRNAERAQFLRQHLEARGLQVEQQPLATMPNLWVRLGPPGPLTVISGHYDKLYDDPEYHGASDNSAAGCVMLAAVDALAQEPPRRPLLFLFTGEEEVGLVGARAFAAHAEQAGIQVAEVLNLDNLGRGSLAVRPSSERPGLYFTLPFSGEWVYDGRALHPGPPYAGANRELAGRLERLLPGEITVFDRMTARSDGSYFQEIGWPVVNLSSDNMYYLNQTWHTYADRIELLDQRSLEQALRLILAYARVQP